MILTLMWPRPYLSWNQLEKWWSSPYQYVKHYIYQHKFETAPMEMGKRIHDAIEKGGMPHVPKYSVRETELRAQIAGGPLLLGRPDGFTPAERALGEYKTGKTKWTQRRVDGHGQFDFYALLLRANYGWVPERMSLHWIPTVTKKGIIQITEEIHTFETSRDVAGLKEFASEITRTWLEIGLFCASEYASMGMDRRGVPFPQVIKKISPDHPQHEALMKRGNIEFGRFIPRIPETVTTNS